MVIKWTSIVNFLFTLGEAADWYKSKNLSLFISLAFMYSYHFRVGVFALPHRAVLNLILHRNLPILEPDRLQDGHRFYFLPRS